MSGFWGGVQPGGVTSIEPQARGGRGGARGGPPGGGRGPGGGPGGRWPWWRWSGCGGWPRSWWSGWTWRAWPWRSRRRWPRELHRRSRGWQSSLHGSSSREIRRPDRQRHVSRAGAALLHVRRSSQHVGPVRPADDPDQGLCCFQRGSSCTAAGSFRWTIVRTKSQIRTSTCSKGNRSATGKATRS